MPSSGTSCPRSTLKRARRRRPQMPSRLTVLAIAVAAPCCCAIHAAPPLPRLHYCCHRSRTATMSTPNSCCKPPDSIIDRAIDRATAETSQKNIINGRLGELKLGASDWMWIYQRRHGRVETKAGVASQRGSSG